METIEALYYKFLLCARDRLKLTEATGVAAAISGGADSMCMLLFLMRYLQRERLLCVHYNHMIRGCDADEDEAFVRTFCAENGIRLAVGRGDVPKAAKEQGISLEEAARNLRYAFLQETASAENACIAVAHTKTDRVETIVHNLARGCSIEGLKGIAYQRDQIIRPILDFDRRETEMVCRAYGVVPREDLTNTDETYERNRIRLRVIPFLKAHLTPRIEDKLIMLSDLASADQAYLKLQAGEAYRAAVTKEESGEAGTARTDFLVDLSAFAGLHEAIQRRLIRRVLSEMTQNGKLLFPAETGIDYKTTERIRFFLKDGINGTCIELPQNGMCRREYHFARFFIKPAVPQQDSGSPAEKAVLPAVILDETGICIPADGTVCFIYQYPKEDPAFLRKISEDGLQRAYFDYHLLLAHIRKAGQPLVLRTMTEGDYFTPFGAAGGKLLRKFLIDSKVPSYRRRETALFAVGNTVIWIPGIRRGAEAPVTEETSIILQIDDTHA